MLEITYVICLLSVFAWLLVRDLQFLPYPQLVIRAKTDNKQITDVISRIVLT